jgi:hypothetical protein
MIKDHYCGKQKFYFDIQHAFIYIKCLNRKRRERDSFFELKLSVSEVKTIQPLLPLPPNLAFHEKDQKDDNHKNLNEKLDHNEPLVPYISNQYETTMVQIKQINEIMSQLVCSKCKVGKVTIQKVVSRCSFCQLPCCL